MKKINGEEEKCKTLELMLKGVVSAVLELEGKFYSKSDINRIKRYLESMEYSVFHTNKDERGKIYHLHIIKNPEFKNG